MTLPPGALPGGANHVPRPQPRCGDPVGHHGRDRRASRPRMGGAGAAASGQRPAHRDQWPHDLAGGDPRGRGHLVPHDWRTAVSRRRGQSRGDRARQNRAEECADRLCAGGVGADPAADRQGNPGCGLMWWPWENPFDKLWDAIVGKFAEFATGVLDRLWALLAATVFTTPNVTVLPQVRTIAATSQGVVN